MRILRVQYRGRIFYAALHDDHVICLNKELGFPDPIPLREVGVMPTVMPSKIVCAAVNYRAHGEELGHDLPEEPRLFLKPPSSVIASGQAIVLPPDSERVDHEGELAVVIGRTARNLREPEVDAYVFGYTCANDVTARDLQRRDGLFGRAKGFDTFCPIGPWIETEVPDPDNLAIRTVVNDTVRQSSSTHARQLRLARHDPESRRRHPDRHARGRGATSRRRRGARGNRGRGHAHQPRHRLGPDRCCLRGRGPVASRRSITRLPKKFR
jgi:hypothetical protein